MARLTRYLQKLFAGNDSALPAASNVAQFASTITGTPNYTKDPATIQALSAWTDGGLYASLINSGGGKNSPVFQELNAVLFLAFRQIQYCLQSGVPEWIATETYYIGQWAQDGAGVAYVSQTNANINNALTDTNNWLPLGTTMKGPGIAKAWVCFGPFAAGIGNVPIFSSFNVTSVYRSAVGTYLITFTNSLGNNSYAFFGSAGTGNAESFAGGNDNIITNSVIGSTSVKTDTQLKIYAQEPTTFGLEDPGAVSLIVFGL